MENFNVENLSFKYPQGPDTILNNINFTINQGDFVLLCGKSGCGKTTLLRLLKSSLSPAGEISGKIYFNGIPVREYGIKEQASQIGFIMQNPDNQIVTDKVWHELAFGLENLGIKTSDIRTRVAEMASFFGIQTWFHKNVNELSGGQKQLLNLASVMVIEPSVLILDEPTSQLDPISAQEFLRTLEKINRELGTTIIISEHRLEDVFPIANRVMVMDNGSIIMDGVPREVAKFLKDINHDMRIALPTPMRVHNNVKNSLPCPLTVSDGRRWLAEYAKNNTLNPDAIQNKNYNSKNRDTLIEIKDIWFRYDKNSPDIIKGLNMSICKGDLFCIVGGNGTGKTTALSLISGINIPYRGDIFIYGQSISKIRNLYNGILGVLPQNPQSLFLKNTVYNDLMDILSQKNILEEEKEEKLNNIISLCQIEDILSQHPYDLSGGEQQRVALAKILLTQPQILLLDEPTKGMDAHFKKQFAKILTDLKSNGVTIVMVSHDIEFCAEYADRCALIFDGNIASSGTPEDFFKGNSFYTTSANRMARTLLPDAVTVNDIILACNGSIEETDKKLNNIKSDKVTPELKIEKQEPKIKLPKRTVWTIFIILLLIPLTICTGTFFLDNKKYYFISLTIIFETLIPFFLAFESRKPKARELIIISVLCAIAVVGRTAFISLPQFKPVTALVIISGVCLGGETGFLIGAVTAFVSNFFFGQGPWTPWQMFSLGIIGFLAGILFKKGFLKRTKISLCIFGLVSTLVIYGGIMNPASVIMWQNKISRDMILSSYVLGLPFDLINAISTVFFLWFLSGPMIDKIERIKTKYGLV